MSRAHPHKPRPEMRLRPEHLTARTLSERDTLRVLALLENPPAANDRLMRAARAGFVLPLAVTANALKRGR
jgi:hypothetical protein